MRRTPALLVGITEADYALDRTERTRMPARFRRAAAAATALSLALAACGGDDDNDSKKPIPLEQGEEQTQPSEQGVGTRPPSARTTFLLSKAQDGGFPNGPSRNAAVSHDQRIARFMAYESDATNIVAGDDNGTTDVFVVRRAQPFGTNGTPWVPERTELASTARGGGGANGPSYRPTLDGDSHNVPHCVAFISDASNLVSGDTNGKPDAFVRDLRSGTLTRVSVDSSGKQSNGATTEVALSGDCNRVAFVSEGTNLALTKAKKPAFRSSVSSRPPAGKRQVYIRVLGGKKLDKGFKGLTFLASASAKGKAGNGDSSEVTFSRSGKAVAFASDATNLAPGDRNGKTDVYRRTLERFFTRVGGKGVQTFRFKVGLVSAKGARAGNGASSHPSITDDGRYVAYQTDATDLLPGDSNGVTDIARADVAGRTPRQVHVSKTPLEGIANGASSRPVISDAGEFIFFDSEASNLRPSESVRPDPNGVRDVFLWNEPTKNVSLESRDAENGYLEAPSQNPATSSRGNYVPFESAYPLIDLPLARELLAPLVETPDALAIAELPALSDPAIPAPQLPDVAVAADGAGVRVAADATAAEAAKAAANAGQQVYLRYLGPK